MRFTLVNLSTQGRDIKLSNKLVENSRNFITKLWNVARFSQFNKFSLSKNYDFKKNKLPINDWILQRYNETQIKVIKHLENFKFNLLVQELYRFIWDDFCDVYIELSKVYLKEKKNFHEISNNFSYVFKLVLNLINPVIPFVSEKISKDLNYVKSSLFSEKFIIKNNVKVLKKRSTEFKKIIELIRNLRSELRNLNNTKFDLIIINKSRIKWIDDNENLIKLFFKINSPYYLVNYKGDLNFVSSGLKFAINYENKEKKMPAKGKKNKIL